MIDERYKELTSDKNKIEQQIAILQSKLKVIAKEQDSVIFKLTTMLAKKYEYHVCDIFIYINNTINVSFLLEKGRHYRLTFYYPNMKYTISDQLMVRSDEIEKYQSMLVEIKTQLILNGILKP